MAGLRLPDSARHGSGPLATPDEVIDNTACESRSRLKKILLCLLILSPAWFVAACCVFSNSRKAAFYQLRTGDTRQAVLARFGAPTHVEREGIPFKRCRSTPCAAPCAERLWFENRLNPELEVWSVELDRHGRVVNKNHLISL